MDYQIQITESLQRVATVSADSEIEAIELVRRLYKEEKIVLDSEDFTDANFIVNMWMLLIVKLLSFKRYNYPFYKCRENEQQM